VTAAPARTSFLAVRVEEPALGAVRGMLDTLGDRVPDVRWVRPEGTHVTVAFLGPAGAELQAAVLAAVEPALTPLSAGAVGLGGLGAFPDLRRAQVIWLGVDEGGGELLGGLSRACRAALTAAALPVETRAYHPHCTVGRPRRRWSASQAQALASVGAFGIPPFTATRVVLLESHPSPGGSRYQEVGSVNLRVS
jgi:2'-5' RNA ligase